MREHRQRAHEKRAGTAKGDGSATNGAGVEYIYSTLQLGVGVILWYATSAAFNVSVCS